METFISLPKLLPLVSLARQELVTDLRSTRREKSLRGKSIVVIDQKKGIGLLLLTNPPANPSERRTLK